MPFLQCLAAIGCGLTGAAVVEGGPNPRAVGVGANGLKRDRLHRAGAPQYQAASVQIAKVAAGQECQVALRGRIVITIGGSRPTTERWNVRGDRDVGPLIAGGPAIQGKGFNGRGPFWKDDGLGLAVIQDSREYFPAFAIAVLDPNSVTIRTAVGMEANAIHRAGEPVNLDRAKAPRWNFGSS
jgi:hypothetical protein